MSRYSQSRALTERQLEALMWTARGYNAREMSNFMDCTAKTADSLRWVAMKKLGYSKGVQVTAWALRTGKITVEELEEHPKVLQVKRVERDQLKIEFVKVEEKRK